MEAKLDILLKFNFKMKRDYCIQFSKLKISSDDRPKKKKKDKHSLKTFIYGSIKCFEEFSICTLELRGLSV